MLRRREKERFDWFAVATESWKCREDIIHWKIASTASLSIDPALNLCPQCKYQPEQRKIDDVGKKFRASRWRSIALRFVNNLSFEVCSTDGLRGRDDLKEKAETAERIFFLVVSWPS